MNHVGVLGGGPWGVALTRAALRAGSRVTLQTRRAVEPAEGLTIVQDLRRLCACSIIVVAVPSDVFEPVACALGEHIDGGAFVVHGVRGLQQTTLNTLSDVLRRETQARRVGALGGPVQASELTDGRPSAIVCASAYPEVSAQFTQAFQSDSLRVFSSTDVRGVEWASALVGVLAIGVGFAQGAGAGPGLAAALISRGVEEAAKLVSCAGAQRDTMFGLGGYGDLLASIALSDRPEVVLGRALSQGQSLAESEKRASLRIEAVTLLPRLLAFAKESGLKLPVFEQIHSVINGTPARDALTRVFA